MRATRISEYTPHYVITNHEVSHAIRSGFRMQIRGVICVAKVQCIHQVTVDQCMHECMSMSYQGAVTTCFCQFSRVDVCSSVFRQHLTVSL